MWEIKEKMWNGTINNSDANISTAIWQCLYFFSAVAIVMCATNVSTSEWEESVTHVEIVA